MNYLHLLNSIRNLYFKDNRWIIEYSESVNTSSAIRGSMSSWLINWLNQWRNISWKKLT